MSQHIIDTIVNHHFELYRKLSNTVDFIHNVEYCITPNNTFPNFIFNESEPFEIEGIEAKIKQGNLPSFWITNNKKTTSLLNKKGFKLIRAWPLLTMNKNELIRPRNVAGFLLNKVETTAELMAWKQLVEAEYNYNFTLDCLNKWLSHPSINLFIGQLNGTVVSATLNFNHQQIVGSHLTATKKEFRKKGIGMQTVYEALNHAFKTGCETSVASTTELGKNAWKKIGYQLLDEQLYINWFLNTSN